MTEFDQYSNNYDFIFKRNIGYFAKDIDYFAKYKIRLLESKISFKPIRILEYGCGTGKNLKFLRLKFNKSKLYGYDPSKESLKIAEKNNLETCFFGSKEKIDGKFDIILVACVLHHINPNDLENNLRFIKEKLSKNGLVFVFEHNPLNPLTRYLVSTCPFDKNAVLIRRSKLIEIMQRLEYKNINSEYCMFFPEKLSFLNSIEMFLTKIPLGGQYLVFANK